MAATVTGPGSETSSKATGQRPSLQLLLSASQGPCSCLSFLGLTAGGCNDGLQRTENGTCSNLDIEQQHRSRNLLAGAGVVLCFGTVLQTIKRHDIQSCHARASSSKGVAHFSVQNCKGSPGLAPIESTTQKLPRHPPARPFTSRHFLFYPPKPAA